MLAMHVHSTTISFDQEAIYFIRPFGCFRLYAIEQLSIFISWINLIDQKQVLSAEVLKGSWIHVCAFVLTG